MYDIKWIRDCPDQFDLGLERRGLGPQAAEILSLDGELREALTGLQDLQQRRNEASKAIGAAKRSGGDATDLMAEVTGIKERMSTGEDTVRRLSESLDEALSGLPNTPMDDVPVGDDEADAISLRTHGEPRQLNFEAQQHYDLGEALGLMDFEIAAKLSGSRFVALKGKLARLHRALAHFMLDIHTSEHGYTEINPPVLVRDNVLFGTGQLPKFADQQFRTTEGYWLIPTAEVPLTNMVMDSIRDEDELPLRLTAWTPCFRSEAGAAGKDTRGMLRQHQFEKVELVSITHPDQSLDELERMTACAEEILKRLGLCYQVVVLATGDMSFAARKTYDLEVWLPGQKKFREISSCSNCSDFQARRMKARFRPKKGKGTRFVHSLNGSGVAVGRALIAVMETYQQADGSIAIPEALQAYMGGVDVIRAES